MPQNRKKQDPRQNNEDRVLRIAVAAVIILFIAGAIVVGVRSLNPRPDTTEGVKRLNDESKTSVETVQTEIAALDEAEASAQEEKSKRSNKEIFKSTLIIGDVTAQKLYNNSVLSESYVLASDTAAVNDLQTTGVSDSIESAVSKNPSVIFLEIGRNDAANGTQTADTFEENYRNLLTQVKEQLPDVKIYVNSIFPVQQTALAETPGYADIPEYNKRLKALCLELNVAYVDNDTYLKDDYYQEDGVSLKKSFYKAWVQYMIQAADL